MNRNGVDADLDAEWTYDNDGKLVTVRYPLGAVYQHGYDEMGRPKTMIDAGTQTTVIGSATYGPAGELLTMGNETRQYNSRLQVTRITHGVLDLEYKYSATQNNGQITAMKDWQSGEEVNYAYDELKRLSSAVTVGPEWGNSYVYDGFGNLLQKNVVKGTAPYMNVSIDPATNKPYSGYSAAGLPTAGAQFDNDNRMIATTAGSSYQEYYAYSPAGKRVWNRGKRDIGGTWVDKEEVWFWGVTGQRMAFYSLTASGNPVFTLTSTNLYMGSKLVAQGAGSSVTAVKTDRLGSVGKFYPWGEERTPTGASGEKFATYYHDVQAAMNYADQRWHGTNGRFQVPDPYQASAGVGDPGSWNRFSYTGGDPVGRLDPDGRASIDWSEFDRCYFAMPWTFPGGWAEWGQFCSRGDEINKLVYFQGDPQTPVRGGGSSRSKPTKGKERARTALDDKCAKALGAASVEQATNLLRDIDIRELPLKCEVVPVGGGIMADIVYGTYDERTGLITLSNDPRLADLSSVPLNSLISINLLAEFEESLSLKAGSLNADIFWAMTILHELGHALGGLESDRNDKKKSLDNAKTVAKECVSSLRK